MSWTVGKKVSEWGQMGGNEGHKEARTDLLLEGATGLQDEEEDKGALLVVVESNPVRNRLGFQHVLAAQLRLWGADDTHKRTEKEKMSARKQQRSRTSAVQACCQKKKECIKSRVQTKYAARKMKSARKNKKGKKRNAEKKKKGEKIAPQEAGEFW